MKDAPVYDRTVEDLGNVVTLEHVNTRVPDQRLATLFYVSGLGLTRDPYLMTGVTNMWINVGRSQFHLPTGEAAGSARAHRSRHPQPRSSLLRRLERGEEAARGHALLLHRAQRLRRGDLPLGQPRPLLSSRASASATCSSACPTWSWRCRAARSTASPASTARCSPPSAGVAEDERGRHARAAVGPGQQLIFRESDAAAPAFDGHHIADLSRRLLRALSPSDRARADHRGERPAPVPLRRHRRYRQRQGAVPDRARGAQHAPPALRPRPSSTATPSRPTACSPPTTRSTSWSLPAV